MPTSLPSSQTGRLRRRLVVLAVVALVAAIVAPLPSVIADVSDTISVVKEGETLSNAEIVARLADATFAGQTNRVLLGREDEFADSIASAVMQTDSPLLLVPTDGPISQRVADLLDEYDPEEVVLLGGTAAISERLATELSADYDVIRRSGPTRIETAIDIARNEAPTADTAILARATGSPGSNDQSQAFADSLASGGWAADEEWPILLSQTEVLTTTVEQYLTQSQIRNVMIMGGTAAISPAVETRLQQMNITTTRVSGPTRFDTAIAVANARGAMDASQTDRVVLVEGQSEDAWAGGFAAAAHSARFDAPVILANGESLPDPTVTFLSGGSSFAQNDFFANAVLTCATLPITCERARVVRGLPPEADVTFDPASGTSVAAGETISVDVETSQVPAIEVTGDCIPTVTGTAPDRLDVLISATFEGECTITSTLTFAGGSIQTDSATYTVMPAQGPPPDPGTSGIVTFAEFDSYAWVPPGGEELLVEIGEDDTFRTDGDPATVDAFMEQISTGDLVTQRDASFAGNRPIEHALTNREHDFYTSGMVGNVDLNFGSADIIEPVSGRTLNSFNLDAGLFTVDTMSVPNDSFLDDISEGDSVVIETDANDIVTLNLTNASIEGPVTGIRFEGSLPVTYFRIDSGGLLGAPLIGDEPANDNDQEFSTPALLIDDQAYFVDDVEVEYDTFSMNLGPGDDIRYEREDNIQTFSLTNGVEPPRTGLATETFNFLGNEMTLLFSDTGREDIFIDADAEFTVGGLAGARNNFEEAYTPGDQITVQPASTNTVQMIELVEGTVQGFISQYSTVNFQYSVSTAAGVLYDGLSYNDGADPFFVDQTSHSYFIGPDEVSVDDWNRQLEMLDVADEPVIESLPAGHPDGNPFDNVHRLTP